MNSISHLPHLDEERDLEQYMLCQADLDEILTDLACLLGRIYLPPSQKKRLLDGLSHLRGHVHGEACRLIAERTSRRN